MRRRAAASACSVGRGHGSESSDGLGRAAGHGELEGGRGGLKRGKARIMTAGTAGTAWVKSSLAPVRSGRAVDRRVVVLHDRHRLDHRRRLHRRALGPAALVDPEVDDQGQVVAGDPRDGVARGRGRRSP